MKNKIRYFRKNNNNLTQEELANMTDVTRQTIIAIEQGKFNPSVKLALKIARALDKKVEELFELEEVDFNE
jgi:putative transcriptional regulator